MSSTRQQLVRAFRDVPLQTRIDRRCDERKRVLASQPSPRMLAAYPTRYADAHGEIVTILENDGHTLRISLDGVLFAGSDLDTLDPVDEDDPGLARFTLASGSLCACRLELVMPLPVVAGDELLTADLAVHLDLGAPCPGGGLACETLQLQLDDGVHRVRSRGRSGWFEDELADLQRQLPSGWYLKACWSCAYSDYSPAGHGLFGALACFRDNKAGYLAVASKVDLFAIWDTMTEYVQETYLCPEFSRRQPGTGYRG